MQTDPGGQGELTRSDLALVRQALRQDWGVSDAVKRTILQRLITYLDVETEEGATCSDRQVIMAARTFAEFMKLQLLQQRIDVAREKLAGRQSARSLVELVGDAEARARELERQRREGETDRDPGPVS